MTGIEEVAAGVTMAEIAEGAAVAGAAVSAYGAISSAQAQRQSAEYNAKIASQNAATAEQQGEAASQAQARDVQRRIGAGVAAYGASGVDDSTGSPADVLADSARQGALDNLNIKYNYKLRALGDTDQANLDEAQGRNASTAGWLTAGGDILSGVSNTTYRTHGGTGYVNTGGGTPIPG